jgi:RNA polymerase sigma factor for flagellar operon FliA
MQRPVPCAAGVLQGEGRSVNYAIDRDSHPKQRLAIAIAKLKPRTQLVLALYYQEGCTHAEVAEILGLTEGRVCQILSATRARLRGML